MSIVVVVRLKLLLTNGKRREEAYRLRFSHVNYFSFHRDSEFKNLVVFINNEDFDISQILEGKIVDGVMFDPKYPNTGFESIFPGIKDLTRNHINFY